MAVSIHHLQQWKQNGRPIVALTAWDFLIAQVLDRAGIDVILVGDSLAMVALGYDTTLPLTLDEILHHAKAVSRGVSQALVVCDLPFLSYQESPQQALQVAGRILKESGVKAVKIEGGYPAMAETVQFLTQRGIPVMGHVGLTPQSVHQFGGFRQQGRDETSAESILAEAIALEAAGAFAVVLEHIPDTLAASITQKLNIPTIGIGAGEGCDGQILVTADVLGLSEWRPKFAKPYTDLRQAITDAVQAFSQAVRSHDSISSGTD
ncbi:MAG: 3-methyl-2-oxobutanoate hydroxymethyltransferase [Thermosynechococcaceae cyanobacterium MS004]|nr:3-methyl-2-oxobutanoate hydroxymethyltransferase [Thermosynechococcaceae cyanobacterium MS004]